MIRDGVRRDILSDNMIGARTARSRPAMAIDVVAVVFGRLLRRCGVATSPAEIIEARRVIALLGASDRPRLRAGLRAVCAKYASEQPGFDRAFDALFTGLRTSDDKAGRVGMASQELPTSLAVERVSDDMARYADYNDRATEVGEFFETPDSEGGFNPHKDDDDLSITGSDSDLTVDPDSDSGRRGASTTVDVERAGSTAVGDLADRAMVSQGSLSANDPAAILAWLDAYDPSRVYVDGGEAEALTSEQVERLIDAVEAFVAALSELGATPAAARVSDPPESAVEARHQVEVAGREILRRMRGAPRPRPREHRSGRLDMRGTVRASGRTDGVPFHLINRVPIHDRVRLLVLADVSLSVRPVTAFALRLAQSMRHHTSRCAVFAFVDSPVPVSDVLARSTGDDALAAVLADERLDLEASSDYGRMFDELLRDHASVVTSKTSVLIVGDGRCNGLPSGVDRLAEISRRAHRVAWVTPEAERYWHQTSCALPDYAEVCDGVVVARDAGQLVSRAADLGAALR